MVADESSVGYWWNNTNFLLQFPSCGYWDEVWEHWRHDHSDGVWMQSLKSAGGPPAWAETSAGDLKVSLAPWHRVKLLLNSSLIIYQEDILTARVCVLTIGLEFRMGWQWTSSLCSSHYAPESWTMSLSKLKTLHLKKSWLETESKVGQSLRELQCGESQQTRQNNKINIINDHYVSQQ